MRESKESPLVGWTNTEGFEKGQTVKLKKELDQNSGLLAGFYGLEQDTKYTIIDTYDRPYQHGDKALPRFFLEIVGKGLRGGKAFCASYLFVKAEN